jgi:hypothetical protein
MKTWIIEKVALTDDRGNARLNSRKQSAQASKGMEVPASNASSIVCSCHFLEHGTILVQMNGHHDRGLTDDRGSARSPAASKALRERTSERRSEAEERNDLPSLQLPSWPGGLVQAVPAFRLAMSLSKCDIE